MKAIRVLFYNHTGDVSGAEINLLLTIEHLNNIDALLVSPEGQLLSRGRLLGIRTVAQSGYRARMSRNPLLLLRGMWGTIIAGSGLRRVVIAEQPQIVHANSIRSGLICFIATVGMRTALIWHVQDALPKNIVGRSIRRLASSRFVKGIIAISEAVQHDFSDCEALLRKTDIVYNGVVIDNQEMRSIRDEVGTANGTFVFAVVGQIARWKRQQDAIRAFALLNEDTGGLEEINAASITDAELWIVGEPKFRDDNTAFFEELQLLAVELGIEKRVKFLGFRTDVMDIMHSIDVLLLPTDKEPFGRVIIEAMLASRAVIGTNAGGVPEIIEDGHTGYLVPIGDVDAFSMHMKQMMDSMEKVIVMGRCGRERVVEKFSIQATADKLMSVYETLLLDQ